MVVFTPSELTNQTLISGEPKVFSFEGFSDNDLEITNVKVSCGCTTPFYPPKIKAGETFYISLQIDLTSEGHFSKSAKISFSDHTESKLVISGTIH